MRWRRSASWKILSTASWIKMKPERTPIWPWLTKKSETIIYLTSFSNSETMFGWKLIKNSIKILTRHFQLSFSVSKILSNKRTNSIRINPKTHLEAVVTTVSEKKKIGPHFREGLSLLNAYVKNFTIISIANTSTRPNDNRIEKKTSNQQNGSPKH